jgi:hypothetical protein
MVLGKHSGRHAFREKLTDLGYDLTKDEIDKLFKKMKDLSDKKKELLDEDIEALIAEEILRIPDVYQLVYLNVVTERLLLKVALSLVSYKSEMLNVPEVWVQKKHLSSQSLENRLRQRRKRWTR